MTLRTATTFLAQSLPALEPAQPLVAEQLNQGNALIQQGNLAEAIAAFRQASHTKSGLTTPFLGGGKAEGSRATQAVLSFALAFADTKKWFLEILNHSVHRYTQLFS